MFLKEMSQFLPCCAAVCTWENSRTWIPDFHWHWDGFRCAHTTMSLVQMNPSTNTCSVAIRPQVTPVCYPHTARWSKQSFSGVQPLWPFIWVMGHMTNILEHWAWHLITVSKSWWYLLLYFIVVVKHLKSGDAPCPQSLVFVWHLCVMVDMLMHLNNPWGKKNI